MADESIARLVDMARAREAGVSTTTAAVAEKSAEALAMAGNWELPRAIYGGTKTMRERGHLSLPREPGESLKGWEARRDRTVLFNGIKRAAQGIVGKPFSRKVAKMDLNPKLDELMDNVDMTGRDVDQFGRDIFTDGLLDGIAYIMPEMAEGPRDENGNVVRMNLEQGRRANRRAYWVQYKADEVYGWVYSIMGGAPALEMLRLEERHSEMEDAFTMVVRNKVRVLYPGWFEVWRPMNWKHPKGDWVLEENGEVTLDYIPFVPFYAQRTGYMEAEPPMMDAAYLNEAHWQSSSDQRHILHVARVPILFGKGWKQRTGQKFEVGQSRFVHQSSEGADLKWVEIQGGAIDAGEKDLERLKIEIAMSTLELLMPKTGTMTATEKAINTVEEHSAAQSMTMNLEQALNTALEVTADLEKIDGETGSLKLYHEFGFTMREAQDIRELREMELAGQISRDTFWDELKRRTVLAESFKNEDEKQKLEEAAADELETFRSQPPLQFAPAPGEEEEEEEAG
jgi:hypothetical protein